MNIVKDNLDSVKRVQFYDRDELCDEGIVFSGKGCGLCEGFEYCEG
jgi:hypothetical protein